MDEGAKGRDPLGNGWMIDGEGRLRRERIASMLRRCRGWDYRQPCIYQITLTTADRRLNLMGRIEVLSPTGDWVALGDARGLGLKPEDVKARVAPSRLGAEILALWKRFGEFTPEIKPLYCEIMPDHLHAILQVTQPMKRPLGNAVGGFKTGCEKIYKKLSLFAQDRLPLFAQERLSQIVAGGAQVAAGCVPATPVGAQVVASDAQGGACPVQEAKASCIAKASCPSKLFSEGFQDTILFHRGQLNNMFNYLRDNARRRAIKALYPDLFRVVGEVKVALKGPSPIPSATAIGHFQALGNRFLLGRPLAQAQVSRSFFGYRRDEQRRIVRTADGTPVVAFTSPQFDEARENLFALAKHGIAIISPCISDGEREIARQALAARLPLVTLHNKGFSRLQKPAGRYFDACADGRLLMLAPAAWPYQPGEKTMTRLDATALNRLAQWIAGDGAAEINYHGMTPANIDALALTAVKAVSPDNEGIML